MEIPNVGIVEFPGDMDMAEIERQAARLYKEKQEQEPAAAATGEAAPGLLRSGLDVLTGAAKGLGRSAVGAGQLVASIPGVAPAIEAGYRAAGYPVDVKASLAAAKEEPLLTPQNTGQKVGMLAEQVGEFFALPTGKAGLVRQAATQAAGSGLLAKVQGAGAGGTGAAAVGGALGPGIGKVLSTAAPKLEASAQKLVKKALGPTKERYKAMAEKIAPEFLKRGVGGALGKSRPGLLQEAINKAEDAGEAVDAALTQHAGQRIVTTPILDALEQAKAAFRSPDTGIVLDKRVVTHLDDLKQLVTDLGPDASVRDLVAVRRVWDDIVSRVGGFEHRATGGIGVPLAEQTEGWAKREGANAIRRVLASDVPDLAAVNKEFHFWKTLEDIVSQTMKREAPQKPGLGRTIMTASGMMLGASSGMTPIGRAEKMLLYGALANRLAGAFRSPRWKLINANLRQDLADAIASGKAGNVHLALARIGSAMGSQAGQ
jgi:hypothetical protein